MLGIQPSFFAFKAAPSLLHYHCSLLSLFFVVFCFVMFCCLSSLFVQGHSYWCSGDYGVQGPYPKLLHERRIHAS